MLQAVNDTKQRMLSSLLILAFGVRGVGGVRVLSYLQYKNHT